MTATYFRLQPADRDPQALLDPAQVSRIWEWNGETRDCADCRGFGLLDHACDTDCGAECDRDEDTCETCDGRGQVDDDERNGVSVCRTEADLVSYFAERTPYLTDVVLVEVEGDYSDDDDFDAGRPGDPLLIHPTRVVDVRPATDVVAALVNRAHDGRVLLAEFATGVTVRWDDWSAEYVVSDSPVTLDYAVRTGDVEQATGMVCDLAAVRGTTLTPGVVTEQLTTAVGALSAC